MDYIYLSPASIGRLAALLLGLFSAAYFFRLRRHSAATRMLLYYTGLLSIFLAANFFSVSTLYPEFTLLQQYAFTPALLGLIFYIQFAYRFSENCYRLEARIVGIISAVLTAATLLHYGIKTAKLQPIYVFDLQKYGVVAEKEIGLASFVFLLWSAVVFVRKALRWRKNQSGPARAAAIFALLSAVQILIGGTVVLIYTGTLTVQAYDFNYAVFTLLTVFGLIVIHANYSNEPASFMQRFVGIALVTLLLMTTASAAAAAAHFEDAYRRLRLAAARAAIHAVESGHAFDPDDLRYIIAFPLSAPNNRDDAAQTLYAPAGFRYTSVLAATRENYARMKTRHAAPLFRLDLDREFRVRLARVDGTELGGFRLAGLLDRTDYYSAFALELNQRRYEVGFSYLEYRRFMHERMQALAWVTLIAALLIVALFPLFFRLHLTGPLERLLAGVRAVNAGDLSASVKPEFDDEIGYLAVSFNRMVRSLQNADRLKDEFLANTSHELRTPLHGIIGITESMLVAPDLSAADRANLNMIASSGRRLVALVNDILDFSRLKSRELKLTLESLSPERAAENAIALLAPLARQKGLALINAIAPDAPAVRADANRFEQILLNLLGNAIKFTAQGEVRISAQVLPTTLEIAVEDTGAGLPPDRLEDVFLPFQQLHASAAREFGGAGIGLSITRQLVELHGGRIRAESRAAGGARFVFNLPLSGEPPLSLDAEPTRLAHLAAEVAFVPDTLAASARNAAVQSAQSAPSPQSSLRLDPALAGALILAVDDEPVNLQVLKNLLAITGASALFAADGESALDLIRESERKPDLVLLDLMMPRMSGLEVCQAIRTKYSRLEMPVLILTARNRPSDLAAGLNAGANDFLPKPFDPQELIARAGTLLDIKRGAAARNQLTALQKELSVARRMQLSLMPASLPVRADWSAAARYIPMESVGGDLYDCAETEDGVALLVADVSGHGVAAALIASMVKLSFAQQAPAAASPAAILRGMNALLTNRVGLRFITACCVFFDLRRKQLRVARAGHLPVFVRRRATGEIFQIMPRGKPLGFLLDPEIAEEVFELAAGDRVVLCTDGLTEALADDNDASGERRFIQILGAADAIDRDALADALIRASAGESGGAALSDDITLIVADFQNENIYDARTPDAPAAAQAS